MKNIIAATILIIGLNSTAYSIQSGEYPIWKELVDLSESLSKLYSHVITNRKAICAADPQNEILDCSQF